MIGMNSISEIRTMFAAEVLIFRKSLIDVSEILLLTFFLAFPSAIAEEQHTAFRRREHNSGQSRDSTRTDGRSVWLCQCRAANRICRSRRGKQVKWWENYALRLQSRVSVQNFLCWSIFFESAKVPIFPQNCMLLRTLSNESSFTSCMQRLLGWERCHWRLEVDRYIWGKF